MILFKQLYWLSCCHLTFRKIWYCLIKTRIDLVSLSLFILINKTIIVFCIGQYEFLWTLEINIHLSQKASVNIVFKVHKNSYWPQQDYNCIIFFYDTSVDTEMCCPKGKCGCQYFILLTLKKKKKIMDTGPGFFLIKN